VGLVYRESTPRTIVGIAGNVRFDGLDEQPQPDLYIPHSQQQLNAMIVVVRTKGTTSDLIPIVRQEMKQMDPDLPLSDVQTMEERIGRSVGQRKLTMLLLAAFAGIGLFLAALGTYGVLSFQVTQRTQEIGIRMALGAHRKDVLNLILQEGIILAVAGTAVGFFGVWGSSRFLRSLVFGISTFDSSTFAAVAILLTTVALFACYLPARRATKVDPVTTLRYE
jgi:putative ABC transport system permease protein